ncbi:MAG: hypothetical protein WBA74_15175, partial [Cyclobacteriaceae bacterium]
GNSVSIRLTSPVDRPPDPISFADVFIYDEEGNSEQFFETDDKGTYRPNSISLPRTAGKQFYLEICTPNGRNYRSLIQEMSGLAGTDSVYFTIENNRFFSSNNIEVEELAVNVFLTGNIENSPEKPVFFRWEVEEVYSIQEAQLPASKFRFYRWNTC